MFLERVLSFFELPVPWQDTASPGCSSLMGQFKAPHEKHQPFHRVIEVKINE